MGATGVGALVGALSLATRTTLQGYGRTIALAATGFGLSIMAFSMARNLWLAVAFLLPAGFAMMTQMAASNTLIQSMVPDALRGRVMAVYSMMFMGMAPIGALLAGTLAGWVGATATVAAGGAFCVAGGLLFLDRLPGLRDEARRLILAQRVVPAQNPHSDSGPQSPLSTPVSS